MALALYFSPTPVFTAQQYDECIKRLAKAGATHPSGRTYHACFGTSESVKVFDVWTSRDAFDKFGQTLLPILKELGVDPGQPQVMEVHNVIVPPEDAAGAEPTGARQARGEEDREPRSDARQTIKSQALPARS